MAVIKNNKTGMWEVRTYYKDLTGARKQKTKRGFAKKSEALEWEDIENEWLRKHKPKHANSFVEMYQLRTQARMIAEEVVLHDVVNCFH